MLPPTARYVAGETADTRAMKGWFTVNDPELILTKAMTDGKAFTVSARVYVPADVLSTGTGSWDGNDKHNMIASLGDSTFGLRVTTGSGGGTAAVQAFVGDGGSWYQIDSPRVGTEFTDQWHDIAVTYEGTNLILYVDGEAVDSRDDAGNVYNSGVPFGVGWDPTKSLRTSELTLESIAVYNEALDAEELAQPHSAADENVMLWMDFEKGHVCGENIAILDAVAPTCTEPGLTEGKKCLECGKILVEQEEIPALGHKWNGTVCENCDATRPNPFVDVPEDSWYINPVLWAVENQVTSGVDETHFAPDSACTRAQVVTFLWAAQGKPEPAPGDNPFVDVTESDWFCKAVLWASQKGITAGVDATHFGPNETCVREQVVTFLWAAKGKPASAAAVAFPDVAAGAWYYAPVAWAVENGVTSGLDDGTFGVGATCTRAQVVTFLWRTFA